MVGVLPLVLGAGFAGFDSWAVGLYFVLTQSPHTLGCSHGVFDQCSRSTAFAGPMRMQLLYVLARISCFVMLHSKH